uniref:Uncharacterized protein n=1 Tax=Eutreptiella gymnastica TaxID=73025 RepID=A0A7S4CZ43_9EUGL
MTANDSKSTKPLEFWLRGLCAASLAKESGCTCGLQLDFTNASKRNNNPNNLKLETCEGKGSPTAALSKCNNSNAPKGYCCWGRGACCYLVSVWHVDCVRVASCAQYPH